MYRVVRLGPKTYWRLRRLRKALRRLPLAGRVLGGVLGALLRRSEVPVKVEGGRFLCRGDAGGVTANLVRRGVYERSLTDLLRRTLRPGARVLDIGANVGYFTVLAGRLAGPGGKVRAFEPDPINFRFLRENVRAAGLGNVELHRCAVGERAGRATLFLSRENPGDHRLALLPGERRRGVPVEVVRVDDVAGEEIVDFVKIDVQGAEPLVLDGMRGAIARSPDLLTAAEWSRPHCAAFGFTPGSFLELLASLSLRAAVLERDGSQFPLSGPGALETDRVLTLLLRRGK